MKELNQTDVFSGATISAKSDNNELSYSGSYKKDAEGNLKECSIVVSGENVNGNANFSQGNISVNLYQGDFEAFTTVSSDFQVLISQLSSQE